LRGGAGYLWSASSDGSGRGYLRMVAIDASALATGTSVPSRPQPATNPVEAKPAEAKLIETKPIETKPAEAKPVETRPVEAPPAPATKWAAPTRAWSTPGAAVLVLAARAVLAVALAMWLRRREAAESEVYETARAHLRARIGQGQAMAREASARLTVFGSLK